MGASKETFKKAMARTGAAARNILLLAIACLITLFFFMLLPVVQNIGQQDDSDTTIRTVSTANLPPPPPPPPEMEMEEEEPPEEAPPPEMEEPDVEPLDLAQLELALNPGFGGDGAGGVMGDFKLSLNTSDGGSLADDIEAIFSLEDLDQAPRPTVQTPPEYPRELRSQKLKGSARIIFIVDKDGRVQNPSVQSASHPAFGKAALQAVKRWRFEPGKRGGEPVQFRMRVPMAFAPAK